MKFKVKGVHMNIYIYTYLIISLSLSLGLSFSLSLMIVVLWAQAPSCPVQQVVRGDVHSDGQAAA